MKLNSKKLLLGIWTPTHSEGANFAGDDGSITQNFSKDIVNLLVPDLQETGRRSLLHILKRQGWLTVDVIGAQQWLRPSSKSTNLIAADFPALQASSSSLEWECIVCVKAPATDSDFRYLRTQLLLAKAIGLTRGVYLMPRKLPLALESELQSTYHAAIMRLPLRDWPVSAWWPVAEQSYNLTSLASVYSGISSQIDRLIMKDGYKKGLTDQNKYHLISLFNQFFISIQTDPGLLQYMYPQMETASSILQKWQKLANHLLSTR